MLPDPLFIDRRATRDVGDQMRHRARMGGSS